MSIRVKISMSEIEKLLRDYTMKIREYNKKIKKSGYYLKPVHIVIKKVRGETRVYRYYGRYWWRVLYLGKKKGRSIIRWVYIGKEKPVGLEEPPRNPLEGIVIYTLKGDKENIYVPASHYNKLVNALNKILNKEKVEKLLKERASER